MKEKLQQLTLSQFIDLICGNTAVLLDEHEAENDDKLAIVTRNIVLEFRSIADPGGAATYLKHSEDWIKAKINVIIFTMCDNLVSLGQYGGAREILMEYGLNASGWTDGRISGTIRAKREQWQRELNAIEAEAQKALEERENIRAQFDTQVASIMAHFKFQIDPATIKAPLYANLVARYNREVKAQIAAMKKK